MRRWLQMEVGRRQVITVVRGPPPREDTLRDNAGRPRADDVPLFLSLLRKRKHSSGAEGSPGGLGTAFHLLDRH